MSALELCWEAVLFDLDGTLVATDRFWPDAARAGALRAFAKLGLERRLPSAQEWMGMVGLPLSEGFDEVFADLEPAQRQVVLEACVEEEHRLLDEGGAGLLPGTVHALDELQARGIPMGIASNCSQAYLDAMLGGLGLSRWITEARCLDSPGIRSKADMIRDLLLVFGTRNAVMVGDRAGDRNAAWANGVPHVHLSRGYAQAGEQVEAEATISGLDEFVPLLGRRRGSVQRVLDGLSLPTGAAVLGVGGAPGAGKTFWLRDLTRALEAQGRQLESGAPLDMETFRRSPGEGPLADFDRERDPQLQVQDAYDLDALVERLEAPPQAPGTLRLVEGRGLQHPRVLQALDRVLWLSAPDRVCERRIEGRDGSLDGPAPVRRFHAFDLPLARALEGVIPPQSVAHLVQSGGNPLV